MKIPEDVNGHAVICDVFNVNFEQISFDVFFVDFEQGNLTAALKY